MKALSVRQPYAWAILGAYKPVENRGQRTRFRGRILIHAGVREEEADVEAVIRQVAEQTLRNEADVVAEYRRMRYLGGIVGGCTIDGCVREHSSAWFCGPWGWTLSNPRHCEPVPCAGQLNFFSPPVAVCDRVIEQWG